MTDAAPAYRPGPQLRPAPARALRVVPGPQSELPTSDPALDATPETIPAGRGETDTPTTAVTSDLGFRVRLVRIWEVSRAYWTPPTVFTHPPATLQDLAAYARSAPWTHQQTGIIRAAGVGWYRFVAYPYTVVSRYREWFAQRPLRAVALLGLVKLLALTGPGGWVVDHLIYPAARAAGLIFL